MKIMLNIILVCFLGLQVPTIFADTIDISGAVWCPNNCYPDKKRPGIMLEIAQKALRKQGYEITYNEIAWSRAIIETKQGNFDALIGSSKIDAPDFVYPKEPVAIARNCFFTLNDNKWNYSKITSLSEVELGVGQDETVSKEIEMYIEKYKETSRVSILSGTDYMSRLLLMLRKKRISAIIADVNVFNYLLKNTGESKSVKNAGCVGLPLKIYLAFSPHKYSASSNIIRLFDEGVKKLRRSGEFELILEKYGTEPW